MRSGLVRDGVKWGFAEKGLVRRGGRAPFAFWGLMGPSRGFPVFRVAAPPYPWQTITITLKGGKDFGRRRQARRHKYSSESQRTLPVPHHAAGCAL